MFSVDYHDFICDQFILNGAQKEVKAIIGPIRLIDLLDRESNKETIVISGCSMYYNCQNYNCAYSKVTRDEAKKKKDTYLA